MAECDILIKELRNKHPKILAMNRTVPTSEIQPLTSAVAKSIVVEIANQQTVVAIDEDRLRRGICGVIAGESVHRANISLAVVDDATIHDINRRFLNHDCPTDVLSFVLEREEGFFEGEIVASAETAARTAQSFGWTPDDELLFYVIHGALHLVGYDDQSIEAQKEMRDREIFYLNQFGLSPRYEERQA
jgi:probable rRNA maturation factor